MRTIPFLTDRDICHLLDPTSLVSALRDVFADQGPGPIPGLITRWTDVLELIRIPFCSCRLGIPGIWA